MEQSRRRGGRVRGVAELVITFAVAICAALLVQAFLVKPYKIPSGSMIPTLAIGQHILVDRLDTHPGLYDIVVFHPPAGSNPDTAICGKPSEGYGHQQACDEGTPTASTETFVKRVVGLPGDHLRIVDGHVWRDGVEEKGKYVQPCNTGPSNCDFPQTITVPADEYYMMGDNRGPSDDSRFWGPVPERSIIGIVFATYWPIDRIGFF
jgi:signal peptidase I